MFWRPVFVVLLILLMFSPSAQAKGQWIGEPSIDAQALQTLFELKFQTTDDQERSLSSHQGKPMLLNFWATWCAPCVREMPMLSELSQTFPEIQFMGLAIDSSANVQKFSAKLTVDYPLWIAGFAQLRLVKQLANPSGGLPFTLLVDRHGKVQSVHLGELEKSSLVLQLQTLKNHN